MGLCACPLHNPVTFQQWANAASRRLTDAATLGLLLHFPYMQAVVHAASETARLPVGHDPLMDYIQSQVMQGTAQLRGQLEGAGGLAAAEAIPAGNRPCMLSAFQLHVRDAAPAGCPCWLQVSTVSGSGFSGLTGPAPSRGSGTVDVSTWVRGGDRALAGGWQGCRERETVEVGRCRRWLSCRA